MGPGRLARQAAGLPQLIRGEATESGQTVRLTDLRGRGGGTCLLQVRDQQLAGGVGRLEQHAPAPYHHKPERA